MATWPETLKLKRAMADLELSVVMDMVMNDTARLADVFLLPAARCHELKGNRKGQFAVYCRHPFRLVLVPDQDPVPRTADGGIDPAKVTKIRIMAVEDYHGR
jgi:hypothetical protein